MEASQSSSKDGQKKAFLDGLNRFLVEKGKPLLKYPLLAGKWIDLHDLYNRVTTYGGCDKVSRLELWDEILTAYGLPYSSPLAFGLQELYKKYLEDYERVHFFGEDAFSNALRSPEARRSYSSFTLPNPPNMLRFNSQLSRREKHSSSYDRVVLSLLSCLPNEVDFAVNACTLLSGESRHVLKLPQCPRIIDALLMHAGFFPTDHGNYSELVTQFCNNTGHDLLQFWMDSVEDETVLKTLLPMFSNNITEENNITTTDNSGSVTPMEDSQNAVDVDFWQRNFSKLNPKILKRSKQNLRQDVLQITLAEKLKIALEESSKDQQTKVQEEAEDDNKKPWSYLFHNRRKLGIADYEGQRILQIALVLLNLSFEDFNVPLLAKHHCFIRFTLLCISSKYASLRQTGLDILSNISPMVDITWIDHKVIELLFEIIHETVDAKDKFEIIKGFDVLGNLCWDKNNGNSICTWTKDKIYKRAIELLLLCDVEVVLAAIEALYRLSKLGDDPCNKIALIINSIEILVRLLTLNVGMFGAENLKNIRIAKRIVQGTPTQPQNPPLHNNAQQHNMQMSMTQPSSGFPAPLQQPHIPRPQTHPGQHFPARPINPQMLPTHMQPTLNQFPHPMRPAVTKVLPPVLAHNPYKNHIQTMVRLPQSTAVTTQPVIQQQTVAMQSQPVIMQQQPVVIQQQAVAMQPQPVIMQQQPVVIQQQAVAMQPQPVIMQQQPVSLQPKPTSIQQQTNVAQHVIPRQAHEIPKQQQVVPTIAQSTTMVTAQTTMVTQQTTMVTQQSTPIKLEVKPTFPLVTKEIQHLRASSKETDAIPTTALVANEKQTSPKTSKHSSQKETTGTPEGAGATYTHTEINASPPVFHYMPAPPNQITLDRSADSFTKLWIWATYELCPENYIPRVEVYAEYVASSSRYGRHSKDEVCSATDFGKCLKHVFPNASSRLFNQGRGHPQYHIAGIKKRATPLPVPGHQLKDPIMITPPCSPASKRNKNAISSPTSKLNIDLRTGEILNNTVISQSNNCISTELPQSNRFNEEINQNKPEHVKNEIFNESNCEHNLKAIKSNENTKNNFPKSLSLPNGIGEVQKKKPAIIDALMKMNGIISPEKAVDYTPNGNINSLECRNGIADESDMKIVNNMLNKFPPSPERHAVIKTDTTLSNGTCETNRNKILKSNEVNKKLPQEQSGVERANTAAAANNNVINHSSIPTTSQTSMPIIANTHVTTNSTCDPISTPDKVKQTLKRKASSPIHSNIPNKITANPTPTAPTKSVILEQKTNINTQPPAMSVHQSLPLIQNNSANQQATNHPVNSTPSQQKPSQPHSKHPSIDLMAPNASLMVLLRNVGKIPIRNHLDESEDPITKSIRLTSALILRNIAKHSHIGRSLLQKHEGCFANIAMSKMDCSPVVAKILQEMNT